MLILGQVGILSGLPGVPLGAWEVIQTGRMPQTPDHAPAPQTARVRLRRAGFGREPSGSTWRVRFGFSPWAAAPITDITVSRLASSAPGMPLGSDITPILFGGINKVLPTSSTGSIYSDPFEFTLGAGEDLIFSFRMESEGFFPTDTAAPDGWASIIAAGDQTENPASLGTPTENLVYAINRVENLVAAEPPVDPTEGVDLIIYPVDYTPPTGDNVLLVLGEGPLIIPQNVNLFIIPEAYSPPAGSAVALVIQGPVLENNDLVISPDAYTPPNGSAVVLILE